MLYSTWILKLYISSHQINKKIFLPRNAISHETKFINIKRREGYLPLLINERTAEMSMPFHQREEGSKKATRKIGNIFYLLGYILEILRIYFQKWKKSRDGISSDRFHIGINLKDDVVDSFFFFFLSEYMNVIQTVDMRNCKKKDFRARCWRWWSRIQGIKDHLRDYFRKLMYRKNVCTPFTNKENREKSYNCCQSID